MQNAPIALFTYNRLYTLKATVKALQQNTLAPESDLIIFADAPKNPQHLPKVQAVHDYLPSIKGFKSVTIIHRNQNYGLAKSIIEGVTEILDIHKKIIVLEDDLITSPNFLCYMNQALTTYHSHPDIFAISGFTLHLPSLKNYPYDGYLSLRPASWGWATWLDQWTSIDWEVKDYRQFLRNRTAQKAFNQGGPDLTRMLKHYFQGKNNSWAIRWSYAQYKFQKYTLYPKISKVQNIGFDSEATHCTNDNIYETTLDTSHKCHFDFDPTPKADAQLLKEFYNQYTFSTKLRRKIIRKAKNLLNLKF